MGAVSVSTTGNYPPPQPVGCVELDIHRIVRPLIMILFQKYYYFYCFYIYYKNNNKNRRLTVTLIWNKSIIPEQHIYIDNDTFTLGFSRKKN